LYVLGRLLYDGRVGLLAAGLGVASPFFLFMAGDQMAHSAELFWVALFMVLWLIGLRRGYSRRWPVAAGVALGMVFLTRQLAAVAVGLPFALATWYFCYLRGRRTLSPNPSPSEGEGESGRHTIRSGRDWGGWRLFWLIAACIPFVAFLFVYQGVVTGSPWIDPRGLFWAYDRVGFGPEVGEPSNVLVVMETAGEEPVLTWLFDPSQPPRGHSLARGVYNIERLWSELEVHLFGWPGMVTLAFVWLAFLRPAGRGRGGDWALLACFVILTVAHVAYWHPGIMYGPRYLYAAVPALLLLTARGIVGLAAWLNSRAVVAVLAGVLILGSLLFYLPYHAEAHRGYNMVSGRELALVEAAAPDNALVFVDPGQGDWWRYGAFFSGNSPWLDGRVIYARDLGDRENQRLMALFPERPAFRWVDERLVPLN
jgi:hypothetical protein